MKHLLVDVTYCPFKVLLVTMITALLVSRVLVPSYSLQSIKSKSPYGQLEKQNELAFEQNVGQAPSNIRYIARGRGYNVYLTADETVLSLVRTLPSTAEQAQSKDVPTQGVPQSPVILRFSVIGGDTPHVSGDEKLPNYSNYITGRDKAEWHTNVPRYARVWYRGIYRGIDLSYYGRSGSLEYDFVVSPHTDPRKIKFKVIGADSLKLDNGELVIHTKAGDMREQHPLIYQPKPTGRDYISGDYWIDENGLVRFKVATYDHNLPLIIDPMVDFSTYAGGSGNEDGGSIATDQFGNTYVVGKTNSLDFPGPNPHQIGNHGDTDVLVTKIDPHGSSIIYSTYIGGGAMDSGLGIAVDDDGNAFITGWTMSQNFPTFAAAYPTLHGAVDAFALKLNTNGDALIYSTFLGGDDYDHGSAIALDSSGATYITGDTKSPNFPTISAFQPSYGGGQDYDAFVTKFSVSGEVIYSTYLGGGQLDGGAGIAVDNRGDAFVTGVTASSDFPIHNAVQPNYGGASAYLGDAFVTKFDATGMVLDYSTYFGGSSDDTGQGIKVDAAGNAYVSGYTQSRDFPVRGNPFQVRLNGYQDAFVSKLNASDTTILYSTYLGGGDEDYNSDIDIDAHGNVFVVGLTFSENFPTRDAVQPSYGGGQFDAYLTALNADGTNLLYSTYMGGSGSDYGVGVSVDRHGNVVIAGTTLSNNFPVSSALQPTSHGAGEFFVVKVTNFSCPNPFLDVDASVFYTVIRRLYCQGIISGVDAAHFSPNALSTRSQFAKLITLGLGYPLITPSQPSFTDVSPSNYAYTFIETANAAHIINGYTAAQCVTQGRNYPCFGPNNNISRAQLIVVMVEAQGWQPLTPSTPTFSDVPAGAFAYQQIEIAVAHSVISGYHDTTNYHLCADAGVAAPCFRPNSPATRGQLAKIVYNTITYPTETPTPTNTATPVPSPTPTDTATPMLPSPTSTQLPAETATQLAPTETATPLPVTETATPLPPTGTATLLPSITPTQANTNTPTDTPTP